MTKKDRRFWDGNGTYGGRVEWWEPLLIIVTQLVFLAAVSFITVGVVALVTGNSFWE